MGDGLAKAPFLSPRYRLSSLLLLHDSLHCFAEQDEKGTWDQKHWEDLMLKVEVLSSGYEVFFSGIFCSSFLEVLNKLMMRNG